MGKIPSDQHGVTTDGAVRVPPHPVYIVPEGPASLSQVIVDFEAFLLDESGEKARYAHLQEQADERFDKEVEEQKRLQAEAALAEETRRREESALEAAMRRVQDTMEIARSDCFSSEEESEEGESERDSESFVSSPSPSESSSSSGSDSEAVRFRPRQMKTSNLKWPRKPRQRSKPYAKRAATPTAAPAPKSPPQEFCEFFTQNKAGNKNPLGENEYWVHSIDWVNAPPTWNGETITAMAADDVTTWLGKNYSVFKAGICKMGLCMHDKKQVARTNLKAHLLSSKHLNLRRKCRVCRFAARNDVFDERHNCGVQKARNAAVIQRSPGPLVPSYTWKPSDL
ncbi:hypothetical protein V8D89_005724 [Ganoderma adspersum]